MRINILFFFTMSLVLFSCKGAKENSNENTSTSIDKREVIVETEEETTTDDEGEIIAEDGTNYSAMSREICSCLGDVSDLMMQVFEAEKAGATSKAQELQGKVLEATRKAEPCMNEISQKYPVVNQTQNISPEIMEALENECPDFAKVMKMRNGG